MEAQLDNLRWEKQGLDVENAKLREANPDAAALVDAEAEATRLREEVAHSHEEAARVEADGDRLRGEITQLKALYEQLLRDVQEGRAGRAAQAELDMGMAEVSRYRQESEHLAGELEELRQTLHESQESEAQLSERSRRAEAHGEAVASELERVRDQAELQRYRTERSRRSGVNGRTGRSGWSRSCTPRSTTGSFTTTI